MKQIFTLIMMALVTMSTFTSCDQDAIDRQEARTLDGNWTGYIETYYYDRWNKHGDTFRTTICFRRTGNYGGRGYEIDYTSPAAMQTTTASSRGRLSTGASISATMTLGARWLSTTTVSTAPTSKAIWTTAPIVTSTSDWSTTAASTGTRGVTPGAAAKVNNLSNKL